MGRIKVKVDTRNRSGKVKKFIRVDSNDPKNRQIRLTLEGSVIPVIKITPSSTVLLSGKAGERKIKDLSISSGVDKPLMLRPLGFSLDGKVSYSLETVKEGKLYKISFQNNPDIKGNCDGYLRLGTNYNEKPEIRIRVSSRFK